MEQLKPKDLVGTKQSHTKRETEAHFNQEGGHLQQRVPRISVDHTNGIPWAWASTLHLSNIPKLNARPGMAQYSAEITEGPHLHPSLPKGLPFSTMSVSKPVISAYTSTSLAVPPPAICPDSFFCPLVCFPQQVDLERGLIHLLSCTLPSSHPALRSCIHLTLHYRTVSLITPFFF